MKNLSFSKIISAALLLALASLTPQFASAQGTDKETVLYSFVNSKGRQPLGTLVSDPSGNLYGAAVEGGQNDIGGTIFELSPQQSGGWSFQVIYECDTDPGCVAPIGSLAMDMAGNLYGATEFGQIFELSNNGSGIWTNTSVYNLAGNGGSPGPLIIDADGNLYGVNGLGGANNLGFVFQLSPASGTWVLTDLHDFSGLDGYGCCSFSSLTMDSAGNLYGATPRGGTSSACTSGCGVVFKLTNNSGAWTETVLHSFDSADGSAPQGPLAIGSGGKLFGAASNGGPYGVGLIFELEPQAGGWKIGTVYNFSGGIYGATPEAPLILDSDGNLYGTTSFGGSSDSLCSFSTPPGCGTAFELAYNGKSWARVPLHTFTGSSDGAYPQGLISNGQGGFFGLADSGGQRGYGVAYELTSKTAGADHAAK